MNNTPTQPAAKLDRVAEYILDQARSAPICPRLAAKVAAVNAANAYANKLSPVLLAVFAPFVGSKVLKEGNVLTAKARQALPDDLPSTAALSVYADTRGGYSLRFTVKACALQTSGSGCAYHEASVYVGSIENQILTRLTDAEPPLSLIEDYTAETVAALRVAAEQAREAARQAENACFPFGLFDR